MKNNKNFEEILATLSNITLQASTTVFHSSRRDQVAYEKHYEKIKHALILAIMNQQEQIFERTDETIKTMAKRYPPVKENDNDVEI